MRTSEEERSMFDQADALINGIAKIFKSSWTVIEYDLLAQGYKPGAISVDQAVADRRIAISTTCPECDGKCLYAGFNKDAKYYRSYAVCYQCDIATKLSSEG